MPIRKHQHRPRGRLILALLVCAIEAQAGWRADAWPSWDHPNQGRKMAEDCRAALVERAHMIGHLSQTYDFEAVREPAELSFWKSQRGNLAALKHYVKYLLNDPSAPVYTGSGYYHTLQEPRFLEPDGHEAYFATTNAQNFHEGYPTPTHGPFLDWTNVCALAYLPTNFLEYTPWQDLHGLGPNVDDGGVGHRRGYVNAHTEAGGPYLPVGRTCWYTTDYGWDGIKRAVSVMTVTWDGIASNQLANLGYGSTHAITNACGLGEMVGEAFTYVDSPQSINFASALINEAQPYADAAFSCDPVDGPWGGTVPSKAYTVRGDARLEGQCGGAGDYYGVWDYVAVVREEYRSVSASNAMEISATAYAPIHIWTSDPGADEALQSSTTIEATRNARGEFEFTIGDQTKPLWFTGDDPPNGATWSDYITWNNAYYANNSPGWNEALPSPPYSYGEARKPMGNSSANLPIIITWSPDYE